MTSAFVHKLIGGFKFRLRSGCGFFRDGGRLFGLRGLDFGGGAGGHGRSLAGQLDRCNDFEEMKVTLLALTLNEVDGVKAVMPRIDRRWVDQILVVDGGSTDGTVEWSRANGFEVYVQKEPGIRHAYLEALPLVQGDVILSISPDGNCPVEFIPALVSKMKEGCDLVIGSRYLNGARSEDDGLLTAFGNWLFTRTVNVLHGARYTDAMVIYRAFTKQLVYDLDLHLDASYVLPERLFRTVISWEPLMSVRAAKQRRKVAEVAVGEPPRIGGKRKLQIVRWGAAYFFQFWWELWSWKKSPGTRHAPAIRTKTTFSSLFPRSGRQNPSMPGHESKPPLPPANR